MKTGADPSSSERIRAIRWRLSPFLVALAFLVMACERSEDNRDQTGSADAKTVVPKLPMTAYFNSRKDPFEYVLNEQDVAEVKQVLAGLTWDEIEGPLTGGNEPLGVVTIAWSAEGQLHRIYLGNLLAKIVWDGDQHLTFECSEPSTAERLAEMVSLYHLKALAPTTKQFDSWQKGNAEVAAIIERFPDLEALSLSHDWEITDEALADLPRLTKLSSINLDLCSSLTAVSLGHLAKIRSLKVVVLTRTRNISDQDVADFQKARPDCEVVR